MKKYEGEHVTLELLDNGQLRIRLTEEGLREELENRHKDAHDDDVLYELMEDIVANSAMICTFANLVPGNLSEAPMIIEEAEFIGCPEIDYQWQAVDDDTNVWFWGDYQVRSMLQEIKANGHVDLTLLR